MQGKRILLAVNQHALLVIPNLSVSLSLLFSLSLSLVLFVSLSLPVSLSLSSTDAAFLFGICFPFKLHDPTPYIFI